MTATPDAHAAAARVSRLLEQLRAGPDPRAAMVAEELVRRLVQLYGAGLERIMAAVGAEHGRDLAADPLVESLLLVHDLHPLDPDARIRRAVARAAAGSAAEVEYLGTDGDGTARVRMSGGTGCATRALRQAITTAVRDAAPETTGVEFDVAAAPPVLLQISRRPGTGGPPVPAGLVDAGP